MRQSSPGVKEGEWITLDGASGRVIMGFVPLREAEMSAELEEILKWADEVRSLKVLANADTPRDAETSRRFGAEGIGLCRTEHMFFSQTRLPVVQRMILAESLEERKAALAMLLPMQRADFEQLFRIMAGMPVTIRLLDPPLHEFLPKQRELQEQLGLLPPEDKASEAQEMERAQIMQLIRKVEALQETNPMLGQRGCRLGIVHPEIYAMQIEALFRAVSNCMDEGINVIPEVMIPLVGHATELKILRDLIDRWRVKY